MALYLRSQGDELTCVGSPSDAQLAYLRESRQTLLAVLPHIPVEYELVPSHILAHELEVHVQKMPIGHQEQFSKFLDNLFQSGTPWHLAMPDAFEALLQWEHGLWDATARKETR